MSPKKAYLVSKEDHSKLSKEEKVARTNEQMGGSGPSIDRKFEQREPIKTYNVRFHPNLINQEVNETQDLMSQVNVSEIIQRSKTNSGGQISYQISEQTKNMDELLKNQYETMKQAKDGAVSDLSLIHI